MRPTRPFFGKTGGTTNEQKTTTPYYGGRGWYMPISIPIQNITMMNVRSPTFPYINER